MSDEQESMDLFGEMHPYNQLFKVHTQLPQKGMDEEEVLRQIRYMSAEEAKAYGLVDQVIAHRTEMEAVPAKGA